MIQPLPLRVLLAPAGPPPGTVHFASNDCIHLIEILNEICCCVQDNVRNNRGDALAHALMYRGSYLLYMNGPDEALLDWV